MSASTQKSTRPQFLPKLFLQSTALIGCTMIGCAMDTAPTENNNLSDVAPLSFEDAQKHYRPLLASRNFSPEISESMINGIEILKNSGWLPEDIHTMSKGLLTTEGSNFGFLLDDDEWELDGVVLDSNFSDVIEFPHMYNAQVAMNGLRYENTDSKHMIFVPVNGANLDNLASKHFGKGTAYGAKLKNVGFELAWLPGLAEEDGDIIMITPDTTSIGTSMSEPTLKITLPES